MIDQLQAQPGPLEIVGGYINYSRPPINAALSDVVAVTNAWNQLVAEVKELRARPAPVPASPANPSAN